MKRIEQVTAPIPAQQQPQPHLPRALSAVRRRAAEAMVHPVEAPSRSRRRGASRFAVALAALAVPLIPGQALGVEPSHGAGGGAGAARPEAPRLWHHLHHPGHGQMHPGPAMTFQEWEITGWTFTIPGRPDGMGLPGALPSTRPDGYYRPWFVEPAFPAVVPEAEQETPARRVSHTNPHAVDLAASRQARSRVVPDPLIPQWGPANTKQMMVGPPQAAADAPTSSCLGETYPAATDGYMVARLRPVMDPMNVVVPHERTPCATRVDYLSQARA